MSYDRPTVKDVRRIFDQYEELVKEYGLIRPGYNLTLDEGSKTYGRAYRVYEVADRSLWGKKGDSNSHDGEYGSGHYEPTIGQNYLGMTAAEACEALITRKRMIYDMAKVWEIKKTNPILDCGHLPAPQPKGSIGTGKAIGSDGQTMCYACSDDAMRRIIANPETQRVTLYVSTYPNDGQRCEYPNRLSRFDVTTWNGTKVGRVISSSNRDRRMTPSGGEYEVYYVTVRMDDDRSKWFGRTGGPGMYVNLKRKKGSK